MVCSGSMVFTGIVSCLKGIFPGFIVPSCVAYKLCSIQASSLPGDYMS